MCRGNQLGSPTRLIADRIPAAVIFGARMCGIENRVLGIPLRILCSYMVAGVWCQ